MKNAYSENITPSSQKITADGSVETVIQMGLDSRFMIACRLMPAQITVEQSYDGVNWTALWMFESQDGITPTNQMIVAEGVYAPIVKEQRVHSLRFQYGSLGSFEFTILKY